MNAEPDEVAVCALDVAERLVRFDHHRVLVRGRPATMLTYHWIPLEGAEEPLLLHVVYRHAAAHPPAPTEVQEIVDRLRFGTPRDGR